MDYIAFVSDSKKETMLNVALGTTEPEREKTIDLNVGFNTEQRTWEIIVKHRGNMDYIREKYSTSRVIELINNYAIIIAPENDVESIVAEANIDFAEKSKNYYFKTDVGKSAGCVNFLQVEPYNFFGQGVLVAILDSGIDIYHRDFQNPDGTTRIYELWDQTITENQMPPEGYFYGRLYSQEEINQAIAAGRVNGRNIVATQDYSGHGTAVAGILAGNGAESDGKYAGVASRSPLLIVKLGDSNSSFPRTTRIMEGIDYALKVAARINMPLVINLSFGNNYGSHNGKSLFESFIDEASRYGKTTIVVGAGNEANALIHISGSLSVGREEIVELNIAEYETKLNLQIWKNYVDDFDVIIETPNLERIGPLSKKSQVVRYSFYNNELIVYYGMPSPFEMQQEIYMDFIPRGNYILSGIYKIHLIPKMIVSGNYNMWLPSNAVINDKTGFAKSDPNGTFTIPSTARSVISVGAYNPSLDAYATFSGRGFLRSEYVNPTLVADGVDVTTTRVGGGYRTVTGTSFATPFVSGGAAMLMEWGIVRENDVYLYGEKVKAYLMKGAKEIGGFAYYPNNMVGAGAMCVALSLPVYK